MRKCFESSALISTPVASTLNPFPRSRASRHGAMSASSNSFATQVGSQSPDNNSSSAHKLGMTFSFFIADFNIAQ